MQPIDEGTEYRIRGRIEQVGPEEFVVTARAIPDNGDLSRMQSLTETVSSMQEARDRAKGLVAKMREIVAMNSGRVTEVEINGL